MARKTNGEENEAESSTEAVEAKVKKCFIIAPIGDDNSEIRQRSDNVMDFIITPALKECGYDEAPMRADRMPGAGQITSQIIKAIIDADMVVADLTDHNPNVFYELAIRHAIRRPIVQIMQAGQRLPFDVSNQRTIFFDYRDLRSSDRAKQAIAAQIRHVEKNPDDVDTPVTSAINIGSLEASNNPLERTVGDILVAVQALQRTVGVSVGMLGSSMSGRVMNITEYNELYGRDSTVPAKIVTDLLRDELNERFSSEFSDFKELTVSRNPFLVLIEVYVTDTTEATRVKMLEYISDFCNIRGMNHLPRINWKYATAD